MVNEALRQTGIEAIGDAPWGTHFCQFYKTKQDLLDLLVPYFKEGLAHNEFCMWVTSEPLRVEEAEAALRRVVPDLDRSLARGQLEILSYADWYRKGGTFDADRVLTGWVEKLDRARARGFEGLRLSGNTFWLETREWRAFIDYEQKVNSVIGRFRMMALCTYSLDKCGASEVIDVVSNHQFALIKREDQWALIESAKQKRTEEELRRLTAELEQRVIERTAQHQAAIHSLEGEIAGRKREEEALRQSEFRFHTVADFTWDWEFWMGPDRRFVYVSPSCERITQYTRAEFMESDSRFLDVVYPQDRLTVQAKLERAFARADETGFDYRILCKDGTLRWVSMAFQPIVQADGAFLGVRGSIRDITERKAAEESLRKIEWLLTKQLPTEEYAPPYGNLLALNTSGEILKSVGESTLVGIVRSYLDLLGTSAAVYEKNGDYACGIFSSGWCRLMDQASRRLCGTEDNRAALRSGKWLCHESCWNDASKVSMDADRDNDVPCKGGIRLYAVPIRAGTDVIGSLNFGYGAPPQDPQTLQALAEAYGVTAEQLLQCSRSYESTPSFILELAKKNARAAAQVIGDMVLRKRAETALFQSREMLRLIVNTIPQHVFWKDRTLHYLGCNNLFARAAGVEGPDEIVGKTDVDLAWKATAERYRADDRSVMERKISKLNFEEPQTRPDGSLLWLRTSKVPLCDRTGQVFGVLGMYEDITEHKRIERELREAEERFRLLVEQALLGVYFIGQDGRFLYVNPKMEEIFGYTQEEFRSLLLVPDLVAESDRAMVETNVRRRLTEEAPSIAYAFKGRRKDGGSIDIEVYAARIILHGVPAIIGMLRDVTQLNRTQAESRRLERLAALGQLLGGIAHELKNPLFILTGYLQIIQEKLAQRQYEALSEDCQKIQSIAKRLTDITERFLYLASPITGQQQRCSVPAILQNALDLARNELAQNRIGVNAVYEPDLPDTWLDAALAREVFQNLILNAVQAMAEAHGRGTLTVSARLVTDGEHAASPRLPVPASAAEGGWIEVRIQDDGPGILPEHQARLFEPFFSTKPPEKGTGLGLWVVRSNLMMLHGTVRMETERGQGTTCIVRLPVVAGPPVPADPPPSGPVGG